MSYIVISDALNYKIAQVVESHKNHLLVEWIPDRSKRKIKVEHQIYPLNSTINIADFYKQVEQLVPDIDSGLLGELIDETSKTSIQELATIYFGDNPNETQITALLFKLASQNIDFYNYQNGSFRKCTAEEREQQLQIQQRQQLALAEYTSYLTEFLKNDNTAVISSDLNVFKLLHKPDKHSAAYKALQAAALELKQSPLEICCNIGLIPDLADYFSQCFIKDNFPNGIEHASIDTRHDIDNLESNLDLNVFSIDDSTTTEIDDAFSLQNTSDGYIIGVHIAAPALNSKTDQIVADNISTVYFPGHKITMLPENIIKQYSLDEGRNCPVVSIYFHIDSEFTILEYYSKVEIVKISANLRIESLETLFNHENLETDHGYPYESELKILHKFALILEENRGRASVNSTSIDYSFSFVEGKVQVKPRVRGNPIDKLVSELMILANCSWGRLLTNAFIPAIYRVKQPNYPVKMTLNADSHMGLNVDYYTWSTSPLRRSADYINQKQIISLVQHKKEFFNATNPVLLEVVENFDSKYSKYIDFQNKMERYWSLQYILQENLSEFNATFIFKTSVQLEGIPIEVDLSSFTAPKPRGTKIRIRVYNINLKTLNFDFKLLDEAV